jgi:hypothetical protein
MGQKKYQCVALLISMTSLTSWTYVVKNNIAQPTGHRSKFEENKDAFTISEHRKAMKSGHLDDKCKQVINDCVQELVCHLAPWHMSN